MKFKNIIIRNNYIKSLNNSNRNILLYKKNINFILFYNETQLYKNKNLKKIFKKNIFKNILENRFTIKKNIIKKNLTGFKKINW